MKTVTFVFSTNAQYRRMLGLAAPATNGVGKE